MQLGTCHFPFQVFHWLFITGPSSSIWQQRPSTTAPDYPYTSILTLNFTFQQVPNSRRPPRTPGDHCTRCVHTLCHFNPLCFFCSCGPYLPVFPSPNTCASLSSRLGVHPPESLTCLRKEETGPPWGYYLWMFRFSLLELYNHQFICLCYLCIFLLPSYYIVTSFLGLPLLSVHHHIMSSSWRQRV